MVMLIERAKLVVEPAGAVGVAALLAGRRAGRRRPVVAVLTGGNIDPLLMMRVIERGLAAAGRYLRFTVRCPDRPGQLAALLTLIGRRRAPTSTMWRTGATIRGCGWVRWRSRCRWRPAARSTPTGWSRRCGPPATRSLSAVSRLALLGRRSAGEGLEATRR